MRRTTQAGPAGRSASRQPRSRRRLATQRHRAGPGERAARSAPGPLRPAPSARQAPPRPAPSGPAPPPGPAPLCPAGSPRPASHGEPGPVPGGRRRGQQAPGEKAGLGRGPLTSEADLRGAGASVGVPLSGKRRGTEVGDPVAVEIEASWVGMGAGGMCPGPQGLTMSGRLPQGRSVPKGGTGN